MQSLKDSVRQLLLQNPSSALCCSFLQRFDTLSVRQLKLLRRILSGDISMEVILGVQKELTAAESGFDFFLRHLSIKRVELYEAWESSGQMKEMHSLLQSIEPHGS